MGQIDVALALFATALAVGSAVVGLLIFVQLAPRTRVNWTPFDRSGETVAFLFEDDVLVDATPEGQRLLEAGPEIMEEWPRLKAALAPRFPDIGQRLSELGENQSIEVDAIDGGGQLRAEWRSGLTRIEVDDVDAGADGMAEGLGLVALNEELSDLRATVDAAPLLVWKEDPTGAVRWANAAYIERALAADPDSETLSWPLPQLFGTSPWREPNADTEATLGRLTLNCPEGGAPLSVTDTHFVAHRTPVSDGHLIFALPGDALTEAEANLREFVQTLTKTFAHLPIGLAVFDRSRRLTIFNPALTDLTRLQPLFLSRRPTLFDFLDQLREARRMPEPRDYRDWRRQISELEHGSSSGTHIETWALPDGSTFRVTGRPHPDGAIAFLIQDITSETTLNRRFRSELELGQSVVDSLDEAIAVFSSTRDLILSNKAYEALWEAEPDTSLGPMTLPIASRSWQDACQPSPLWEQIQRYTAGSEDPDGWRGMLRLKDGRGVSTRVVSLPGNALLFGFRLSDEKTLPRLARTEYSSDPLSPSQEHTAPRDRQRSESAAALQREQKSGKTAGR